MRSLVLLCLAACSVLPAPEPARYEFVVLTAESGVGAAPRGPSVELGRVNIPAYLDRVEVVTRTGSNQITFSGKDRWGEPLATALPRVLAADLGAAGVALSTPGDFMVEVEIERFEIVEGGGVEVAASWRIQDRLHPGAQRTGNSRVRETTSDPTAASAAASLSRAVAQLAGSIASSVRQSQP